MGRGKTRPSRVLPKPIIVAGRELMGFVIARVRCAITLPILRPSIRFNIIAAVCIALILSVTGSTAFAQQRPPKIWDIPLGTPVGELPEDDFVDPACGTNGGTPGLRLSGFEQFEKCRAEASGLHEVWFRYDDELEMIARATRDLDAVVRNNAMLMLGQPAILSLLIDRAGLMQGYRILTDPRAEPELRKEAYTLVNIFKARFGATGWDCNDLPPGDGETPVDGVMVKQHCQKIADGQQISLEARHYYKLGQALVDPNTNQRTVNQFESSSRIEVVSAK